MSEIRLAGANIGRIFIFGSMIWDLSVLLREQITEDSGQPATSSAESKTDDIKQKANFVFYQQDWASVICHLTSVFCLLTSDLCLLSSVNR